MKHGTKTVLTALGSVILVTVSFADPGGPAAPAAEPDPAPALTLKPQLASPFGDNAVLQQKMKLPVWGTSLPGAKVTVTFDGQTKSTAADAEGQWRVTIDPLMAEKLKTLNDAPTGKTMTVTGEKDGRKAVTTVNNLLVGDVWVCAGQSNMAGRLKRAGHPKNYPPNSVTDANYPSLRLFQGPGKAWAVCSPDTVVNVSRVAFFFIRRVQRDALIPMGVIVTAVGGSSIESWLKHPEYPTGGNYDRLLKPVVGFGIRGAIWYQGESNSRDGRKYQAKLEALINGWRRQWNEGDFPFHFVQLPGIGASSTENPAGGDGRAEIRQAYVEALRLPNTGLAVTIDIGDVGEHPVNKYDTGVRLARSVLQKVYGFEISCCPLYKKHVVEGKTVRVSFDNAEMGLMVAERQGFLPPEPKPAAEPQWLAIQSNDGSWHWARGTIDGSDLIVSSDAVTHPVAVRYAYRQQPKGNLLYNKDGMPVGPFSTCGYDSDLEALPK